MIKKRDLILSAIKSGEMNGVHLSDLVQISGEHERVVRRIIEGLRLNGAVICSNEFGYFYPATMSELEQYLRQETARSRSITRRTAAARRLLKQWKEREAFEGMSLFSEGENDGE